MSNKVALVFGHSSGLGYAVTEKLIQDNIQVVGISRKESTLDSSNLTNYSVDLSDKEELDRILKIIREEHPVFDILVFAAGTLTAHNIDNLDYDKMKYLYQVNTFAPMYIESQLLPLIKENGTDVINVTSSALIDYYPTFAEYGSSKAAFAKFTKDLQAELSSTSARVTDLCPSGFTSNIYKTMTGDKINRDESKQMKAEDLAGFVMSILQLPKVMEVGYVWINRK